MIWFKFLSTSFEPSNIIDGDQKVLRTIFVEMLKVLLSPYLNKNEKAELLQDVQQIFKRDNVQQSEIMSLSDIIQTIHDPF